MSKRFGVIFVHIPKTGGQSVERVFLEAHGLTWATRAPLLLRRNDHGAPGPEFLSHLYAEEYAARDHASPAAFERAERFTVVRDPFDRLLS